VLADSAIDWGALLEVLWASALGGVGVTAAFALTLLGATRAVDMRRDGRAAAAGAFVALAGICGVTVVAAVVFGVVVMTSKG
jgi:hypothetical protein